MSLLSILKRFRSEHVLEWKLPPQNPAEKARIEKLRAGIRALPALPADTDSQAGNEWSRSRRRLRRLILRRDPRNFLNWQVVRYAMVHECQKTELDSLKHRNDWPELENALVETSIGNPKHYHSHPASSGNLIHHAYTLAQFLDVFPIRPAELNSVFEFGGGYGSFARLLRNLGFQGNYTIFDLPEFLLLQEYFLSVAAPSFEPHFISDTADIRPDPDLFVAMWSISETPMTLREKIWNSIGSPWHVLIGYQERFHEADNSAYFESFIKQRPQYEWVTRHIAHLPRNRYLFGKRKV